MELCSRAPSGFFSCSPTLDAAAFLAPCSFRVPISLPPLVPSRHARLSPPRASSPTEAKEQSKVEETVHEDVTLQQNSAQTPDFPTDVSKVIRKTAATFAPRSSTRSKNPAVPGSTLYTVFEVQGYLSMAIGGLLSFNLVFPSNEPDIWRLMGMWSVWMFSIPSLRARDCSSKEKDALNYLFLGIPLINVLLPILWKSFAAVWVADVVTFFIIYAWKLDWLSQDKNTDSE